MVDGKTAARSENAGHVPFKLRHGPGQRLYASQSFRQSKAKRTAEWQWKQELAHEYGITKTKGES